MFNKQQLKSSLAITTQVGCRNHCSYCPQKTFIQAYKRTKGDTTMTFETFAAAIRSVPRDVCLSFSGFCEPWQNPDCTQMLLHAHQQGFRIRVNTTLIGMQAKDMQQMKEVPFIKFVVHLPDDREMTRIPVDEHYLQMIEVILETPPLNLMWKFHPASIATGIHPRVKEVLQDHGAPIRYFGLNSRAGKVESISENQVPNQGQILRPCQDFHHNILLPSGDVALCHMDWSLKHILGNLLHMDYSELHTGKAFMALLESLEKPEADILCRQCEKDNVKRSFLKQLLYLVHRRISGENDLY